MYLHGVERTGFEDEPGAAAEAEVKTDAETSLLKREDYRAIRHQPPEGNVHYCTAIRRHTRSSRWLHTQSRSSHSSLSDPHRGRVRTTPDGYRMPVGWSTRK